MYLKVAIIYGYKFRRIFKIVDLAGINFSCFAITCSINLKICDKLLILAGTIFLAKMGQFAKIAKSSPLKIVTLRIYIYI